jgi:ferritin
MQPSTGTVVRQRTVEEESSAQQILDKLQLAGPQGVYFLDRDIMNLRGK